MIARLLMAMIRLYQRAISPFFGRVCRFEPSCSHYALACIETHGAGKGCLLSFARLCKCHPFHPGGFDPVPIKRGALSPRTAGRDDHPPLSRRHD
jgi:putative membrane protein insertion efficiency factor